MVGLSCCLPSPHLWIDESLITLCQRVRFQRRGTLFLIILVPMNGRIKCVMTVRDAVNDGLPRPCPSGLRIKSAMTDQGGWFVLGLFTLTLVLSHQGRGDIWLVCLVVCPALTSGLRIKSAMTGPAALWILP